MPRNGKNSQRFSQSQNSSMECSSQEESTSKQLLHVREISKEIVDEVSNDVLLYLLSVEQKDMPIKQAKLKSVSSSYSKKVHNNVINNVRTQLKNVFDIELIETENKEYYLLNNQKQNPDKTLQIAGTMAKEKRVLLILILMVVKKNGGVARQEELLDFLRMCDIIENTSAPIGVGEFIGIDMLKFLKTEMVDKLYLKCEEIKTTTSDFVYYKYIWGERAIREVNMEELEALYSRICNDASN